MDLELLLTMAVSLDEARPAVTSPDGRSLGTGQLQAAAAGAATLLRQAGRNRVAFCDTNGLTFPVTLFGAVAARLPLVPLNYRLADTQLEQIVAEDELVVASADQGERLGRVGGRRILAAAGFVDAALEAAPFADAPMLDPDDVALVLYTSGTTSAPKAALLRHRHLAAYVIGARGGCASQRTAVPHCRGHESALEPVHGTAGGVSGRLRSRAMDPFDP